MKGKGWIILLVSILMLLASVCRAQLKPDEEMRDAVIHLPLPTRTMLNWADAEIGTLIHFDMPVYDPSYQWDKDFSKHPPAELFNPLKLSTDQWVEVAKKAGANYVVLVAKHASGFCLWPTKAHPYSVASSPWRDGKGDVVGDFINSCKKYGIMPGIYCTSASDAYFGVKNGRVVSGKQEDQQRYNEALQTQLTELWGNYGDLFEIWFDGGTLSPSQGGLDVIPLLQKYQPEAVVFQGPAGHPNLIRWIGNEDGRAPYPCWSAVSSILAEDGTHHTEYQGSPDGKYWCPGESDFPIRQKHCFEGGWFWKAGEEQCLFSVNDLVDRYYTSVGHNTNMLIGMVVNDKGLVPEADEKVFVEFGESLQKLFSKSATTDKHKKGTMRITLPGLKNITHLCLAEDLKYGERVREFLVEGLIDGKWQKLGGGECIGHKWLVPVQGVKLKKLRATFLRTMGKPMIREFSVYYNDR